MDLILKPVRVATSKPARQTYLNTLLFLTTSAFLLGLAVIAYLLFYFNYVPQIGIERVLHLQYGDGPHPYGIASLDSSLVHDQPYDINLSLHVPRSPTNLEAGNFMLSLSLLSPTYTPPLPSTAPPSPFSLPLSSTIAPADLIFTSRRPALLTYTSRLISLSERLLALPLYLLRLRHESETLHIPMAESISFKRGYKNIPAYILLEIQAGQEVQVYDIHVNFTARFGGLRWLMYNHRIISLLGFTAAFWFAEMIFAALGWLAVRAIFTPKTEDVKREEVEGGDTDAISVAVKQEEETDDPDLSDTPRTFPTSYWRQPPLRYVPKVKDEDDENVLEETEIQPLAAEADDEDEEGEVGVKGGRTDSGIGTSFSEGGAGSGLSRRRSRGGAPGS